MKFFQLHCLLFSQIIWYITFLVILCFPTCFGSDLRWFESCGNSFRCGSVIAGFPFWGGSTRPKKCGHPDLELSCENNATTTIQSKGMKYHVLNINHTSQIIRIAREDFQQGVCMQKFINTTLDFKMFTAFGSQNITVLYGCPPPYTYEPNPSQFMCKIIDTNNTYGYPVEGVIGPSGCYAGIVVPVVESAAEQIGKWSLSQIIGKGFEATYKVENEDLCGACEALNGRCGFDQSKNETSCLCPDGSVGDTPCKNSTSSATAGNSRRALIIGVSVGALGAAALLCCCAFIVLRRRRRSLSQAQSKDLGLINMSNGLPPSNEFRSSEGYTTSPSTYLSQSFPSSYPSSKSDFENSADHLGIKVFGYDELEKATEHFHESHELGDGGFGTVYYGKLNDGRLVAVKRLYENSCRHMGQFLNEIHILNRLRHKNLVTLYGCTSRRSRDLLLVYEYISNGTVADHLHGKLAHSNVLPWPTRLSIAVETAEALCFLHENDVIHRDVKTTNILLENNFRVKVADFGLSRLFPDNVTHVSTAPQGTPGYVDPEYYQCYQLTEKSDVFSFGVVLAELLSSKVAVDISRHRHDINLANMALDRIQKHAFDELIDPKLGFEKDFLAQKMLKLIAEVAFQCLQQEKEARPTMKEVLESLKAIQKEMENSQQQVVLDIHERDDIGLLKNAPPPLSPGTDNSNMSII